MAGPLELVGALNAIAGTRSLEAAGAANAAATRIDDMQAQIDDLQDQITQMAEAPSALLSVGVATLVPETTTSAVPVAFSTPCTGQATIGVRPVIFYFGVGSAYSSQVNGKAVLHLMEDGNQIAVASKVSATVNQSDVLEFWLTSYTPTPGVHTYEVMKSKGDAGTTANFIGDNSIDIPDLELLVLQV